MKTMNKVLAVSILAMLAVPAAHAKIVAETMLTNDAGHYSSTHTVQSEINAKQDTLVASGTGQNIQGSNGVSVSKDATSGMITVGGTAATNNAFGVVKTGTNISNSSGTISVADASTSGKGVIEIATDEEATTGTSSTLAVTPKQLKAAATAAASSATGSVTATGSNGVSASASNGAISVSGVAATDSAAGVIKIANASEISAGTSTTTAVTPAQLKAAKEAAASSATGAITASGSNGVTASASNGAITVAGTAATGSAFGVVKTGSNITNSSGTISVADASTSAKGVIEIATDTEASTGTSTSLAVTPKQLATAITTAKSGVTASGSNGVSASASNGAITVSGVDATPSVKGVMTKAETYDDTLTDAQKKATAASVLAAEEAAQAAAAGALSTAAQTYQLKSNSNVTTAGDYITTGNGVATNLTNLDTALKAIHPNTGQVKIPSGSETSSTMASIWVE